MTNSTFASLFTGFGGADLGAINAGLKTIWGIEKDLSISKITQKNHWLNVYYDDVTTTSYHHLVSPDWLHASPPCTTATIVNNKRESQEDIDLARSICRAIEILQPEYFSLENVEGYRYYKSFELIKEQLTANDYNCYGTILDASDYGVPQSRRRLFLIASKNQNIWAWNERLKSVWKKVSWYDAIADLIPTLTPTTLTGWQKEAIFEYAWNHASFNPSDPFVIQRSGARKKDGVPNNNIRLKDEPMFTVKAMSGKERPSVKQATIVIDGQAYEADTRCLMRWQTFPDNYQISGNLILDTKGFGNAVPPLMFKQIVEAVLN